VGGNNKGKPGTRERFRTDGERTDVDRRDVAHHKESIRRGPGAPSFCDEAFSSEQEGGIDLTFAEMRMKN
jgi:hypothetical protein